MPRQRSRRPAATARGGRRLSQIPIPSPTRTTPQRQGFRKEKKKEATASQMQSGSAGHQPRRLKLKALSKTTPRRRIPASISPAEAALPMLESDVQLGSSRAYPGVRVPGASKEAQEGHRGPVAQARDAELGGGASGRGRRGGVGTARGRGGAVGGVRAQPSPRRRLGVAGDGDPVVVVCALPAQPRHAFLRGDRSF